MRHLRRLYAHHDWAQFSGVFGLQVGLYLTWPHSPFWARLAGGIGISLAVQGVACVLDWWAARQKEGHP